MPCRLEPRGGTCGQAVWAGLTALSLAGALIDHNKLLLQINPERELGDMSYKLGQVSHTTLPRRAPARSAPCTPSSGLCHLTRSEESEMRF